MAPFPPWEDLQPELLCAIANFLEQNSIDVLRFRSACQSWFSSLSPPRSCLSPPLPLMITAPHPLLRTRRYLNKQNYVLSATVVFAIRPIGGGGAGGGGGVPTGEETKSWIAFVDELNTGRVSLREPFSKKHHDLALDFPRRMDVIDLHVSEIGRFYNLTAVSNQDGRFVKQTPWSGDVQKIVLFSDGSGLLVLFEVGRLGLLKLGGAGNVVAGMGTEWHIIHNGKGLRFDDIIEFNGRLLGIDRRGKVYDVSTCPIDMKAIVGAITGGGGRRKRLVESLGVLYLVVRWFDHGPGGPGARMGRFKVYVMNEERKKWVEISNLNDRIFFFGQDFSFSASAENLEGFVGTNCIAYYHLSFEKYSGSNGESWLREESKLYTSHVGVYELTNGARPHAIESHPGYSNTLGMHPNWLWPNKKSKLLGVLEAAIDRLFSQFYLMGVIDEELKANYRSLSPVLEAIVSGDGISQQDTRSLLEQADTLKLYLNDLTTTLEDEIKFVKKFVAGEAWIINNLLNRERTSNPTVGAEGTNGGPDTDLNAWLSKEMTRKLGTHCELLVLLQAIKRVVAEKSENRRITWNLGNNIPSLG